MKRKSITKHISLMLIVAMLVQTFVVPGLFNGNMTAEAADSEDTVVYEDGFDYQPSGASLVATDEWDLEWDKKTGTTPEISNGVMTMTQGNSVNFNWHKVTGGFNANSTYKFDFDVKMLSCYYRDLYVAMGGYINFVVIPAQQNTGTIEVGKTFPAYQKNDLINKNLHIEIVWRGDKIVCKVTDKAGNELGSGTRQDSAYTTMEHEKFVMTYLTIRCEVGSFEVDNFNFSVGTDVEDKVVYTEMYSQDFENSAEELHLLGTKFWDKETYEYPGEAPEISKGVMNMSTKDSVQFNWTEIDSEGAYDSNKKYTFEFDLKLKTLGSERALYVAPGGYYNQVEISQSQIKMGGGEASNSTESSTSNYKDQNLHVRLEWKGSVIESFLEKEDGTLIVKGKRDKSTYTNKNDSYMKSMVLRCEEGKIEVDNFKFSVNDTLMYTEDFSSEGLDPMKTMLEQNNNIWAIGDGKEAQTPTLADGKVKMHGKTSLQFNWKNVPNVGEYDELATYTFEFDMIYRNPGKGWTWDGVTRVLFVSNNESDAHEHIGFYDGDGRIKVAGSQYVTWSTTNAKNNKNTEYHIKIEWTGNTVTSTITDATGDVMVTGSRTVTVDSNMDDLTLRCEDGAIDIDNFKFTKDSNYETAEQDVNIPSNKQAVYESNIEYSEGATIKVGLAGKTSSATDVSGELFKITDDGMFIGGYACAGSFGEGTYKVKLYLNPTQQAGMVEVTLPNDGVIRRGSYQLLNGCENVTNIVKTWRGATEPISKEQLTYEDIDYNTCVPDTTEPEYEGFEANVYNLVTAFDVDAKTTRTFAWTALESFVGDEAMAVQYRVKGTSEWQSEDAVKEIEKTAYPTEDYFKADITGLTAGTTYEYRIGKKNSADETNDWGDVYTFTTEAANVNEFSFVSIGDTQGTNWDGTSGSETSRGFMYAQAALKQAMADVANPAFILHTGDVVETGATTEQWNKYFKALGDLGKSVPHFAAIGNHDTWGGSSDNFDLHFNHPDNGGSKAFAEGAIDKVVAHGHATANSLMENLDETTYSFDYGNAHFVVLNTGMYDDYGTIDKDIIEGQLDWLEQDLKDHADAEWTIVMMHQPAYHRLGGTYSRPGFNQILEKYDVDLAIVGHSHIVTRTYPMKNGEVVSKTITDEIEAGTGTVYSTIGSTTPFHDKLSAGIQENIYTTFTPVISQPTYQTVTVNDYEIKVTIKQIDGLVVDEFVIFKEAQEFKGATLELGGKIGVNFYVPKHHGLSDDAFVEFKLEDGETQNVSIKDAKETKYGVKFTCWIPAKEMADEITATLYDGGAMKDQVSTSVKTYAETIISASDDNADYAKAKPLVNAMLNYGAYAQKLFGHNTENLANNHDKVVDDIETVTESDLEQYAKETQGLPGFGSLVGTSLILKGETKLKMFFEFEAGVSLEDLTFSINGVPQGYTISGGRYVVEIADISAHQLDKDYTVTVSNGNYSFEATTSAMTYCYNALINKDEADLHNVVKALYLYNQKADAYKNASN